VGDTAPTAPGTSTDPVRAAASRRPAAPALISDDTTLSWAELDTRVEQTARWLTTVVPGGPDSGGRPRRVAVVLGTDVDFAVTYFGVLRAGLVAVPLNPAYTADELGHALTDSGSTLAVTTDEVRDRLAGASVPAGLSVVPPRPPAADLTPDPPGAALPAVPDDALAVLLYTSGTGGRPKGAMLTHAALAANHRQLARIDPPVIGADDVVLLAVPLFHAYGLNTGLGAVAHHGACGVLIDRFEPAASLAAIARHRVTVAVGVPTMVAAWARRQEAADAMRSLRVAVCGAAPLDPADATRFTDRTGRPILVGYGLTEAAPVLTTTAVGSTGPAATAKAGSIGRPLPGVELLLRTADGQVLWRDGSGGGVGVGVGVRDVDGHDGGDDDLDLDLADSPGTDPGEIVVRGANLFAGYWPDGRDRPDADGWWGTGDIAYADGDGDLHLVDRIGELILVNGFNVYPAEIERVLGEHPGVAEAAVVAVPDPHTGQTPRAYVVPAVDPAPTPAELLAHCAGRLARFKLPTSVAVVAELPHSAIGKVRKTQLKEAAP
jgi:long-chain acyl-CoA synthetase